jgi:hypothetical protein
MGSEYCLRFSEAVALVALLHKCRINRLGQRLFESAWNLRQVLPGRPDAGRPYRGSGLGLALAEWIAEKHGTSISLESTVGAGSRFGFMLPFVAVASPLDSSAAEYSISRS